MKMVKVLCKKGHVSLDLGKPVLCSMSKDKKKVSLQKMVLKPGMNEVPEEYLKAMMKHKGMQKLFKKGALRCPELEKKPAKKAADSK